MNLNCKRHYPLIILVALVLILITVTLGDQRIIAYTTAQARAEGVQQNATDIRNDIELFDDTVIHSIQVLISDTDYQQMLTIYQTTGLKEYMKADVFIDGVRINNVGIRLKGNASLRTAVGGGVRGMQGGNRQPFEMPSDGELPQIDPENMPNFGQRRAPGEFQIPPRLEGQIPEGGLENAPQPGNRQIPPQFEGALPGGFDQMDGEAKIPFLIKFNAFVSGQTYQGYTSVAIRTYGASPDTAMLQEPLTNEIARLAGLPATQTAYSGFQINDQSEQLYVISEVINQSYVNDVFENSNGVLYKAELGSTLSFQGEDPSAYANSFTQQTRVNDADLAPLIAFIRFLDTSDDTTFASALPDYLDVDAFATYLAINNLLVNTDSLVGMNNNYYLYYDDVEQRFTLLMWDANESFGKLGFGANSANYDLYFSGQQATRGFGGGQNTLVTRFMANAEFKALYEDKVVQIYKDAFLSGAISQKAADYATLVHSVNAEKSLVNLESYDQAIASLLSFVDNRMAYLNSTPLLSDITLD